MIQEEAEAVLGISSKQCCLCYLLAVPYHVALREWRKGLDNSLQVQGRLLKFSRIEEGEKAEAERANADRYLPNIYCHEICS